METTQKNREQAQKPAHPKTRPAGQAPAPQRSQRPEKAQSRPQRPQHAEESTQPRKGGKSRSTGKTGKKAVKMGKNPLRRQKEPDDTLSSKRRAYGNSKPKEPSKLSKLGSFFQKTVKNNAAKTKKKQAAGQSRPQQPTPAVIYTEPKAFNRRRFVVQMATVGGVVLAMVLGLSVFFKVETITVTGAQAYSPWDVREASGISEGDNLLSFGNVRAGALIKANLPYVEQVRIGIKLPDTVNIIVKEEDVVYAIKSQDGLWWLITSDGRVVEQTNGGKAADYTQILGVTLDQPIVQQKAIATENVPVQTAATTPEGQTQPPAVTGAKKLEAALKIVNALEANGIVGEAASVDVSKLERIVLWYGSRYQVDLGDDSKLEYKIDCMHDAILQLSDYQTGYLDLSFTIWPDKVVYTPFE